MTTACHISSKGKFKEAFDKLSQDLQNCWIFLEQLVWLFDIFEIFGLTSLSIDDTLGCFVNAHSCVHFLFNESFL